MYACQRPGDLESRLSFSPGNEASRIRSVNLRQMAKSLFWSRSPGNEASRIRTGRDSRRNATLVCADSRSCASSMPAYAAHKGCAASKRLPLSANTASDAGFPSADPDCQAVAHTSTVQRAALACRSPGYLRVSNVIQICAESDLRPGLGCLINMAAPADPAPLRLPSSGWLKTSRVDGVREEKSRSWGDAPARARHQGAQDVWPSARRCFACRLVPPLSMPSLIQPVILLLRYVTYRGCTEWPYSSASEHVPSDSRTEVRLPCRPYNLAATSAIVLCRRFYIVKSIRRNDHVVCLRLDVAM
jgi:hypothetical protein